MKSRGFTLIETIIYTALVGIVITGFITFALLILGLSNKNYVIGEVNANARTAINLISQKIKQAEEIVSPAQSVASSTLILQMPNERLLTISVSDNVLTLDEDGSVVYITSDEVAVTDLSFINLANVGQNDNIKITFNISYNNAGSMEYNYQQSLQTAVSLRR
jgi:type II secretory pathway pseudopilin PulG